MTTVTILLLLLICALGGLSSDVEKKILDRILKDYHVYERPVQDERKPMQLTMGVSLRRLIDLDEKNQLLTANLWLTLKWRDYSLNWNKSDFNDVKELCIPTEIVWTPDILLYNSASPAFNNFYKVNICVSDEGECNYMPPGIIQSTCQIDITWFPFDEQQCSFKFGSWTHDGKYLNLTLADVSGDLTNFKTNVEWEILGMPAERHEFIYDCCKDMRYQDATYTIQLRRRTLYYLANWTLPCLMIVSMAVLGFYFPPDSGEKITLEITILMSLTFFMNMVTDMQPPSSETPLVGIYFSCIMIMVASSVICTILVLNYHHRPADNKDMPDWFRKVFLKCLPKMLFMAVPKSQAQPKTDLFTDKIIKLELEDMGPTLLGSKLLDMTEEFCFIADCTCVQEKEFKKTDTSQIQEVLDELRVITTKIQNQNKATERENEWKFAAMVLDRVCLLAFTFLTILLSTAVVIASPQVIVW